MSDERDIPVRNARFSIDTEAHPPRQYGRLTPVRAPALAPALAPTLAPALLSRRQGVQRRPAAAAAAAAAAPRRRSVDFARAVASPLQRVPVLDAPVPRSYAHDDGYNSPEFVPPVVISSPTERTRLTAGARAVHYDEPSGSRSPSSGGARSRESADGYDDEAYDSGDPEYAKSVYMLSLSILMITSVVFVIIVSGLTKLISRRASERLVIESDWPDGGFIPEKYGCRAPDGHARSFPLAWRNVPPTATNLVILFANPTSLSEKNNDPVHWFVTDIPLVDADGKKVTRLPANASLNTMLMPSSAKQRPNVHEESGRYYPPCPSTSSKSLFVLHVYAIDASAVIDTYIDARQIMNRFVGVPSARLSGKYGFSNRIIEITGDRNDLKHAAVDKTGKEKGLHTVNRERAHVKDDGVAQGYKKSDR